MLYFQNKNKMNWKEYFNQLQKRTTLICDLTAKREKSAEAIFVLQQEMMISSQKVRKLQNLRIRLSFFDDLLDHEDASLEIDAAKRSFICWVHKHFPESIPEHTLLENSLQSQQSRVTQLTQQLETWNHLYTILHHKISETPLSSWQHFFSIQRTKVQIGKNMHAACALISSTKYLFKNTLFLNFLERLQHEASKSWNQELYKGKFYQLLKEAKHLLEKINEDLNTEKEKLDNQQSLIDKWLEQFSEMKIY